MKLVVALLAATCRVDAFNVPAAPATPMGTVTRSAPAAMFFGAGAAKPAKTAKKGKPAAKKTVKKPVGALLPLFPLECLSQACAPSPSQLSPLAFHRPTPWPAPPASFRRRESSQAALLARGGGRRAVGDYLLLWRLQIGAHVSGLAPGGRRVGERERLIERGSIRIGRIKAHAHAHAGSTG